MSAEGHSFGNAFNENGGGVYALLLDDTTLRIWFFPRESVPVDIEDGIPKPETWTNPMIDFESSDSCSIGQHWRGQTIVRYTQYLRGNLKPIVPRVCKLIFSADHQH